MKSMQCAQCGEKLNAIPGRSVNFCPNCGSKIAAAPATAAAIDSAEAALRHIAENYGADVLLGSKIVTYFADVTRNQLRDEKELIKILQEKGALECLKEAMQKPVSEQKTAIKRAMSKLPKFLGPEDSEAMLRGFAAALGWQLPQPQPAPPPKQLIPAQTPQHTVILPKQTATNKPLIVTPAIGSIHRFANIDWRVLDVDKRNNKVLLISEEILEKRPYNVKWKETTWENCTLRKYLNGEFLDKLGAEKSAVAETRNSNPNNQWYGTAGGSATNDKVFLLSLDEICRYFGDSTANLRRKSGFVISDENNPNRVANYGSKAASWWWLRSPGSYSGSAAFVYSGGSVAIGGDKVGHDSGGVRPALWLNL
jgi:hypothetical protein